MGEPAPVPGAVYGRQAQVGGHDRIVDYPRDDPHEPERLLAGGGGVDEAAGQEEQGRCAAGAGGLQQGRAAVDTGERKH